MECIPEEATATAFDNQAYLSVNYPQTADSGFDSYEEVTNKQKSTAHQQQQTKYENVEFREEEEESSFPSYENVEDESYENIEPPLNYQNIDFVQHMPLPPPILPPPSLQSLPNLTHDAEAYENLQFQSLTEPIKTPVYAISSKKKTSAPIAMDEEAPVYENYDFQEQAIYQNMLVNRTTGKLVPAKINEQQGNKQHLLKIIYSYSQKVIERSELEVILW